MGKRGIGPTEQHNHHHHADEDQRVAILGRHFCSSEQAKLPPILHVHTDACVAPSEQNVCERKRAVRAPSCVTEVVVVLCLAAPPATCLHCTTAESGLLSRKPAFASHTQCSMVVLAACGYQKSVHKCHTRKESRASRCAQRCVHARAHEVQRQGKQHGSRRTGDLECTGQAAQSLSVAPRHGERRYWFLAQALQGLQTSSLRSSRP